MEIKSEIKDLEKDLKQELELKIPSTVETYHDSRQTKIRFRKTLNEKNELHSYDDKPAVVKYNKRGQVECMEWYNNGQLHRTDNPARFWFYTKRDKPTAVKGEEWFQNGDYHREDGPAITFYYVTGEIETLEYYKKGQYVNNPNDQYVFDRGMKKNIANKKVDSELADKLRHDKNSMTGTNIKGLKTFKEVRTLLYAYEKEN